MKETITQAQVVKQGFSPSFITRFWAKVNKNGPVPIHRPRLGKCWVWTGCRRGGYGQIKIGLLKEGLIRAHRASWIIHFGIIPDGHCVLHKCDNRACVRKSHLFTGTVADNNVDMIQKGRAKLSHAGENNPRAKISWPQVHKIRRLYASGKTSLPKLGLLYGVSHEAIWFIVKRKHWKNPPRH